ncbi:STAS domain-containing protein [Pseudonocardia humida]|uniref:Anti-anti-sigma regulatory factor n=1 Tax=Pseudonocardia humida TaxID=2800819 RepID=A0ABT0ZV45_9PSEU|nr:hypothetical protein [Pseudonocardia humida]MCO1654615.1 hypothetical protein [Pseudonocardia humida]
MSHDSASGPVFGLTRIPDAPIPGRHAVLLTARVDIDLSTRAAARDQLLDVASGPAEAVLMDLTGVFVGAVAVRDLVELAERTTHLGKPLVVIGAPPWLPVLAARLDMPPLRFTASAEAAVSELRAVAAAADGGVPA